MSDWLKLQVSSDRVAGASVLIGRQGHPAFFEATGWADVERRKPFTEDTIVRIYSMTKPVTSVAAMMLYEQGAFQLDDPLHVYLPEFRDVRVWAGGDAPIDRTVPAQSPINVRQIMTHTAGLTYGLMQTNVVDAAYREPPTAEGNHPSSRRPPTHLPAGLGLELQRRNRRARSTGRSLVRSVP